jgi:kynurenine formamidase
MERRPNDGYVIAERLIAEEGVPMQLIDLTREFNEQMPVYPGDPDPVFEKIAALEEAGYVDYKLSTGMHVGTHMDAPLHMVKDGAFMSQIPIEKFIGRGILLDARGNKSKLDRNLLEQKAVNEGDILFILTGHGEKFNQPDYYTSFPHVSEELAKELVSKKIKILGLDTPSPDQAPFQIHKILLGNEVLIIENLDNLEKLVGVESFEVIALPAKLRVEAAPVRVVARIEG